MTSLTVGPSSSHTVGPMRAGKIFIGDLEALGLLDKVGSVAINTVLPACGSSGYVIIFTRSLLPTRLRP